jgi:hypothetical protein
MEIPAVRAGNYLLAMVSISTATPLGSAATSTAERAGGSVSKNEP